MSTRRSSDPPGLLYQQIPGQSLFLTFMDCFRVLSWVSLAMIPLVLAIRKFRPSGSAPSPIRRELVLRPGDPRIWPSVYSYAGSSKGQPKGNPCNEPVRPVSNRKGKRNVELS